MTSITKWNRPSEDMKPPISKDNRRDNMPNVKGITIEIGIDSDKVQSKLRAIAKHTEALADELDAIDNDLWCEDASELINNDEDLPTRLEGSE